MNIKTNETETAVDEGVKPSNRSAVGCETTLIGT